MKKYQIKILFVCFFFGDIIQYIVMTINKN